MYPFIIGYNRSNMFNGNKTPFVARNKIIFWDKCSFEVLLKINLLEYG
jgi:hypothetical protein